MNVIEVDDPPIVRDAKAGFSSWCRRGQHATCARLRARCTDTCHGRYGQTPPPPPSSTQRKEGTPMPDTTTKAIACPETGCIRTFGTEHALSIHRARGHKGAKAQTPPQPPAKRAPVKTPAAKGRGPKNVMPPTNGTGPPGVHLVVVQHEDDTHICPLQTAVDADKVMDLLELLGITANRYEKAHTGD